MTAYFNFTNGMGSIRLFPGEHGPNTSAEEVQ